MNRELTLYIEKKRESDRDVFIETKLKKSKSLKAAIKKKVNLRFRVGSNNQT